MNTHVQVLYSTICMNILRNYIQTINPHHIHTSIEGIKPYRHSGRLYNKQWYDTDTIEFVDIQTTYINTDSQGIWVGISGIREIGYQCKIITPHTVTTDSNEVLHQTVHGSTTQNPSENRTTPFTFAQRFTCGKTFCTNKCSWMRVDRAVFDPATARQGNLWHHGVWKSDSFPGPIHLDTIIKNGQPYAYYVSKKNHDIILASVVIIFGTLVVCAPLFHRKYLAVMSRTRECDRLTTGFFLFEVKFLHFLFHRSECVS